MIRITITTRVSFMKAATVFFFGFFPPVIFVYTWTFVYRV